MSTKRRKTSSSEDKDPGPGPSAFAFCDLNKDLNLLQQNLSVFSNKEKDQLRSLVAPFVARVAPVRKESIVPIPSVVPVGPKDTTTSGATGDPNRVLIRQIIRLMLQYENYYKHEHVSEDGGLEGFAGSTENEGRGQAPQFAGVTREALTSVLLAFLDFFERKLTVTTEGSTPLTNGLILRHIFGLLPMKDLKNCRLVSKFWSSSTSQLIRYRHRRIRLCEERLTVLNSILDNSTTFPFEKYVIKSPLNDCDQLIYFLIKFGEHVKDLKICTSSSPTLTLEFEKIVSRVLRNVPNLEILRMNYLHIPLTTSPQLLSLSEAVLEDVRLPNVRTLSLSAYRDLSSELTEALLQVLPNLENVQMSMADGCPGHTNLAAALKNTKNLVQLNVLGLAPGSTWDCLAQQNHKLKFLMLLGGFWADDDKISIERFLKAKKDCLEEIRIISYWIGNEDEDDGVLPKIEFPLLPKLRKLDLFHDVYHGCSFLGIQLNPDRFGALRSLSGCWRCIGNVLETSAVFRTVKEFRIPAYTWYSAEDTPTDEDMESIRSLGQMFPNLIKFTSYYGQVFDEFVESIFGQFPKLEELDLELSTCLESQRQRQDINHLLGGLTESHYVVNRIMEQKYSPEFETLWLPLCFNPDRTKASLRDLKSLKKLRLKFEGTQLENSISDISVYATFLRMSPLSHLILEGNISISKDAASQLAEHHPNLTMIPNVNLEDSQNHIY